MKIKICHFCGKSKPITDFRKTRQPDYMCKECNRKNVAEWRRNNPGENAKNCKKWYHKNKKYVRNATLIKKYRISLEEYKIQCELQNNLCEICGQESGDGILRVDHNHKTGKIRGLLCDTCNRVLGLLYENREILFSMIKYLDKE